MQTDIDREIDVLGSTNFAEAVPFNVWSSFTKVAKASLLPEQTYGEDRPSEDNDFLDFKADVAGRLEVLSRFIKEFVASASDRSFDRDSLVWAVILSGEHNSVELWTTEDSRKFSTNCVQILCSHHCCTSLPQLLLGLSNKIKTPIFKQALLLLRPKLLKETWRKHPGAVATYKWLLTQIVSPHLSQYLDVVYPTTLLILDDHDEGRKLGGLHCLSHIVDNVARTDLCQRGLDQVFYKTLQPLLWQRSACQIEPAINCLTKLLSLTERGYTRRVEPGMWDLFDDTLNTLIDKMVFEDQIPLRIAYIRSLGPLLSEIGPSVIRWSKPLLAMFDEYMCKESFDTRKYALDALNIYIELSSARLEQNGDFILFVLLRTLTDISYEAETSRHDVDLEFLESLRENIILVAKACPQHFHAVVSELGSVQSYYGLFQTVLNE